MPIFDNLNVEHARWFSWWPVGMGIGILLYFELSFEPRLIFSSIVLLLTIGVMLYGSITRHPFYESSLRFFLYGIISIIVGFTLAKIRTNYLSTPMLKVELKNVQLSGVIKDIEHIHRGERSKRRVTLILQEREESSDPIFPKIVRLNGRDGMIPGKPGDTIQCLSDVLPVPDSVSLQGYDSQIQLYFAGIGAVGRIKGRCHLLKSAEIGTLTQWRYHLTQMLRHKIPGTEGEIAAALVTGDRSGIPKNIRQNFTDAGIAHILAISGLHISLVAGLVFWIVRRLFSFIPYWSERFFIKKWSAVISVFATGGYLAISGFGFPAQRAFIMTTFVMLGICLDRSPLSLRSVAMAAIFILTFFPESILSVSFQLSFAAVIALISAYESSYSFLKNWVVQGHWLRRYLVNFLSIILTTLIATAATTPLIISTFNRFTMQAVLGNLLAIPLTSFWIMPMALVSMLVLFFQQFDGGIQNLVFHMWALGIEFLVRVASIVSSLPGSVVLIPTPHPLFLILTLSGGLWLALWKQPWRYYGFVPIGLGLFMMFYDHHPDVYMAGDGSVIAYRDGEAFYASSLKRGRFYVDIWARELGITKIEAWPSQVLSKGQITLVSNPYNISKESLTKYCTLSPWMISNGYIWKTCRHTKVNVIDRFHLKKAGPHFLWVKSDSIKVLSMKQSFGKRPWRGM
jgi:competence protein ComEC